MTSLALGPEWLTDPTSLIQGMGAFALVGLALIVFAECGLLLGFFLPGDSLLFTAGLLVATGELDFPLWLVCGILVVAAVVGNLVGYSIGRAAGPALFDRPQSRFFRPEHVAKTHEFFERYGGRAIILARFVPIVRTFITAMAGVGRMDLRQFAIFSTIGAVIWGGGVTVLGYYLGQVEWVRHNIEIMLLIVVAVSLVPVALEVIRSRRTGARALTDPPPAAEE